MTHHSSLTPMEWAKHVNRSWLVRSNLNEHAESWLSFLASLGDGRFQRSCENARAMCYLRGATDDPKPWFYAGLFHLATFDEAKQFLENHRITKATVPSMAEDESVRLWIDRISPETLELLDRIRLGLGGLPKS